METATKIEKGKQIAGDYDLMLLRDLDDDMLDPRQTREAFAVGHQYDPSAGITGGAVSPWYGTAEEAFSWCADNEEFLKGQYGDEPEPRRAQCYCCKRIVEVNDKNRLQFIITPRPEAQMDSMYCGCRGWD